MKVLVNALPARDGGGLTYLLDEIRGIESAARGVTLEVLVSPWAYEVVAETIRSRVRRVGAKGVADRFLYEQTVLRMRARECDLLYCPLNFGPVVCGGKRTVLTIHNSNYFGRGLTMPGTENARPWAKVKACHAAARQCRIVVAISDSLRDEIVRTLPEVEPKVRVVKSGRPNWDSVPSEQIGLPDRQFVLAVGSAGPHKRLEDVVTGWSAAVRCTGEDVGLVVAGQLSRSTMEQHRRLAGAEARLLTHLGMVRSRGELRWLYERATALVSMSVLEAFPLTVTEAGALGCPLVLTDIPAHREVSLGNAMFVQPGSPGELAGVLSKVFRKGPQSCEWRWPITWEAHGAAVVELFKEVAG